MLSTSSLESSLTLRYGIVSLILSLPGPHPIAYLAASERDQGGSLSASWQRVFSFYMGKLSYTLLLSFTSMCFALRFFSPRI